MPSNFIKILLTLVGLSPALLVLYFVKLVSTFSSLKIYLDFSYKGFTNFIQTNYLLLLFVLAIIVAGYIVKFAKANFAIGRIEVKQVKPADINFTTVIFSIIPLLVKLYNPEISDVIILIAFFLVGITLGLVMKSSYHFNIVLKLLFGYNHYEVQTMAEVTYLMLSKEQLINKKYISQYVKLADHMLLNVTNKP